MALPTQSQLIDLDPQDPTKEMPIDLGPGEHEEVDFPYCEEDCPEDCCVGDLHEVVIETKFCIDDFKDDWQREWFDIYAYFWDSCKKDGPEIDFAGMFYKGDFPGAVTGYNDVLTIESVRVVDCWAIVRLRLTAQGCAFPRGFFGKKCRTVGVWFNGIWHRGKVSFRCECVRPGSWFTWEECCKFPECEEKFTERQLDRMILDGPPSCCDAEFLTRETVSWENWVKCLWEPPECKRQSESCKCGYNLVEFELDYWVKKSSSDRHEFELELDKWGYHEIDFLKLRFNGDEWHGEKKSENGYVYLKSVYKLSRSEAQRLYGKEAGAYADLWRVRLLARACDRIDGNPRALPEQLEFETKLDDAERDFWLDLGDHWDSDYCLETGKWYYDGSFMGVNIIRWLSVEDAAWCPPFECEKECKGCGGYCRYCPEPDSDTCDCDKDCKHCKDKNYSDVACGCAK